MVSTQGDRLGAAGVGNQTHFETKRGEKMHSVPLAPSSSTTFRPPIRPYQWPAPKRKGGCHRPQKKLGYAPISSQLDLKPPPYPLNALEPHMSRQTLELHWGRHHRGHVESLNRQIAGTELDGMGLQDIVAASYNNGDLLPSFNHAAQIWNHDFFWQSMKPGGGGRPSGDLLELIERDFGSFEGMLKEFQRAATTHFGSGWAWLVYKANRLNVGNAVNPCPSEKDNKLVVVKTPNAVNPLVWDYSPILVIDVWEHAYYLDYEQNRRADYVSTYMEKLVSWDVVSSRLEVAMTRAAEKAREDERRDEDDLGLGDDEAVEMYVDSENDDPETE